MNIKRKKGDKGEEFTAKLLKKKGHKIIERNFSVHDMGEIDIISMVENYIVFTEVKTRKNNTDYSPREAVDNYKQQRIRKTAQYYLMQNEIELQPRFDVAEVFYDGNDYLINIIENAF